MKRLWASVVYLLFLLFAILLLAKVSLWLKLEWLASYRGKIDLLLLMFAGICGVFLGAMGRSFFHMLTLLAGSFLVLQSFFPPFAYSELVCAGALILILVMALFGWRASAGQRKRSR